MSNDLSALLQSHLNGEPLPSEETADRGTYPRVISLISSITGLEDSELERNSNLEDIALTSLNRIEFSVKAEGEFGLRFDEESAQNFRTIDDIVNFIERAQQ